MRKKLLIKNLFSVFVFGISSLLWVSNANAFSYHDNVVNMPFNTSGGYSLVNGSYTLTDYSVSSGQDPDDHIKVGQVRSFSGNKGSMTFSVGRHKTDAVAKWFTNRIPASKTTFNHDPGALNFAFIGTLQLELTGGLLGTNKDTYTLNDVAIAQGSTPTSNNWWFGGKNCTHTSTNMVTCTGTSSSGYTVKLQFHRGGNGVNTIDMESFVFPPYQTKSLESNYAGENTACVWQPAAKCPPFVTYYNSTQTNTLKLTVKNNTLYNSVGKLFDTTGADSSHSGAPAAIFVMSPSGGIYASNANKVYLFHHSSILAGGPVASAGELFVVQGVIQKMTNCSGHYRPGAFSYQQLKESLKRMGYSRSFTFESC